jgi:hypothetical protein
MKKINKHQRISNTDWHLSKDTPRPYEIFCQNIFKKAEEEINSKYRAINSLMKEVVKTSSFWFQQYSSQDNHTYHIHRNSIFSCVYYVDFDEETPKTTFKLFNGEEFEIEAKEGEVLMFPSYLSHTSKENKSDKVKTVIAFNLS